MAIATSYKQVPRINIDIKHHLSRDLQTTQQTGIQFQRVQEGGIGISYPGY